MPEGKRRSAKARNASASSSSLAPARAGGDAAAWLTYTSPDGRPYYYNSITKESRWKPPKALRSAGGADTSDKKKKKRPPSSRHIAPVTILDEDAAPAALHDVQAEQKQPDTQRKSERRRSGSAKSRGNTGNKEEDGGEKRDAFHKLQASLAGRLNAIKTPMMMAGPPPMLKIDREAESHSEAAVSTREPSLEEQYEAETAGMSAAERLRFLRRKRQEAVLQKRQSVAQDDFLAEFASNMKKKELVVGGGSPSKKQQQWKEQEAAEEERKRKQMLDEAEVKQREEAQAEKERRREEERREQEEQEKRRKEERRAEKERRQQERQEKEAQEEQKRRAEAAEQESKRVEDTGEKEPTKRSKQGSRKEVNDVQAVIDDKESAAVAPAVSNGVVERDGESKHHSDPKKHRHRDDKSSSKAMKTTAEPSLDGPVEAEDRGKSKRRQASSTRSIPQSAAVEEVSSPAVEAEQSDHHIEGNKVRAKKSKSKNRDEDRHDANPQAGTTSSGLPVTQEEDEEETRAREKRERREKRRLTKLETAQRLEETTAHTISESISGAPTDSSGHTQAPSSTESQHSHEHHHHHQAPGSGMCPHCHPYPYMMPPPPPLPPYGYYYPYMPPPYPGYAPYPAVPPGLLGYPPQAAFAPPMMAVAPQTQLGNGMEAAVIPYNGDPRYAVAAPTLDRCEGCHGVGVALVEKNGFCAHCNRLKLEFIVASARMRVRCSGCGGWGYQLVDASTGLCSHCSRLKEESGKPRAGGVKAVTTATADGESLGDIEWDESESGEESDWDD